MFLANQLGAPKWVANTILNTLGWAGVVSTFVPGYGWVAKAAIAAAKAILKRSGKAAAAAF
jgi:hypothetical protein